MREKQLSRRFLGGSAKNNRSAGKYGHSGGRELPGSRLRKKLADSGGLTLIEMLCATLILILLCAMLATGLGMAVNSYYKLTAEAETELLLNTITDALADELRYSQFTVKEDLLPLLPGELSLNYQYTYLSCSAGVISIAPTPEPPAAPAADPPADPPAGGGDKPTAGTLITTRTKAGGSIAGNPTGWEALLPDGAYGTVYSTGGASGEKRRYEVVEVKIEVPNQGGGTPVKYSDIFNQNITSPPPGSYVTFTIYLKVKDRMTGVSKETPGGGIVVRCLNPVKKIE